MNIVFWMLAIIMLSAIWLALCFFSAILPIVVKRYLS